MNAFFAFLLSNFLITATSIISCISGIVTIAGAVSLRKHTQAENSKDTEKTQGWKKITIAATIVFIITLLVLCLQYIHSLSLEPAKPSGVTSPAISSTSASPTSTPDAMPPTPSPTSLPPTASPVSIASPTTATPAPGTSSLSGNASQSRQDNENGDNIGAIGANTSINADNSAVDIKENTASGIDKAGNASPYTPDTTPSQENLRIAIDYIQETGAYHYEYPDPQNPQINIVIDLEEGMSGTFSYSRPLTAEEEANWYHGGKIYDELGNEVGQDGNWPTFWSNPEGKFAFAFPRNLPAGQYTYELYQYICGQAVSDTVEFTVK